MNNYCDKLLYDLHNVLPYYQPYRKISNFEEIQKNVWKLCSFRSKWPESINSSIIFDYLSTIKNFHEICKNEFRSNKNSNKISEKEITFFVRTYSGDSCWLEILFSSIKKFAPKSKVVVCIEEKDVKCIDKLIPNDAKIAIEKSFCHGTIQQKYSKLTADLHCETDYIIYLDSDSVLVKPFNINDWVYNGKPCLEYTTYKDIKCWFDENNIKGGDPTIWKNGVSRALGKPIESEFSRRLEKIYLKAWLPEMRNVIENVHNMSFKNFISMQKGVRNKGDIASEFYFSDFNYMGAYLWLYRRDDIHWLNTSIMGFWCRPLCAAQFHSYTMTENHNGIKRVNSIPKEFVKNVFSIWESGDNEDLSEIKVRKLYNELRAKYRY